MRPTPRPHPDLPRLAGRTLAALSLFALVAATPLSAQGGTDTTSGPTVTVLDGVYTADQAERGQATYTGRCAGCHAPAFFEADAFLGAWAGRPVRSLFRRLRQTMPEDNPGGLRPREYAAVIAYILELNGFPAGEKALPDDEEALRAILMVEKEGGGG